MISENLQLTTSAVRSAFFGRYETGPNPLANIAFEVASVNEIEQFGWLADTPGMREWVGERIAKGVGSYDYKVTNKLWESTIAISRFVADSPLGAEQGRLKAEQMADDARQFPYSLAMSLINAGATSAALCYDGKPLFAANHADVLGTKSVTQSNVVAATAADPTAPTVTETIAALRKLFAGFAGIKNSEGRKYFRSSDLRPIIFAPMAYAGVLRQLQKNAVVNEGSVAYSNEFVDGFDYNVEVELDAPTASGGALYAFLPSVRVPGLVFSNHTAPTIWDNAAEMAAGRERDLVVGATTAFAVAPGEWRAAAKIAFSK